LVTIDGHSYLVDDEQITCDEFYRLLPKLTQLPTTSACPLGVTQEILSRQAVGADHLILITAPKHLSAIYNNFRIAAEEIVPGRYTLIDSGQITLGAGFQVIAAAEAVARGATVEDVVAELDAMRRRVHIFAVLNTLENLRRSGRVNWATAMAGTLFQIKPVLELTNGDIMSVANIRSFKRATSRLREMVLEYAPLERLAILHTDLLDGAQAFRDSLADIYPTSDVLIINVNPSIGTHVGAKGLGVALVSQA
jgi:DegV family protein with EDD domain